MLRAPHLDLIARHAVRHSLRGGAGLIAILATIVIGLLVTSIVTSPLDEVDRRLDRKGQHLDADQADAIRAQVAVELSAGARKTIGWVTGASDDQLDHLTGDKPALVSAILVLIMLVTPLCACLGGFNQTSGDIGSKGLRYLLFRTERENIFVGRFIGTAIFMATVFLMLFAILAVYIALKIHVHPTGDMMAWLAGGYLRVVVFALPYVALCAWVSSAIDSPFGSLMFTLMFAYLWPLLVIIGSMSNDAVGYLQYVTPWGFKWWLFSEQPAMVAGGVAAMLAFTAGLVVVGLNRFTKRDL